MIYYTSGWNGKKPYTYIFGFAISIESIVMLHTIPLFS